MKLIIKGMIVLGLLMAVSCSDLTDLDINQNPNAVAPENAEVGFLYNQIQLDFALFANSTWTLAPAARMRALTSFFYREQWSPQSNALNSLWRRAYADIFIDINAIQGLNGEGTFQYEAMTTKILQSYVATTLVDIFGDIPFDAAGKGAESIEGFNPANESGEAVYAKALALLDEAIAGLATASNTPANDLYYGGDKAKWITLANTLKLRIYANTYAADSGAGSAMAAVIAGGDFIDSQDEDFVFQSSSNRNDPDSRHPFYQSDYESSDGGYMSNYYMWLLVGDKGVADPRTRFYFYRQQASFSATSIDINNWDCVVANNPFVSIPPGALDHLFAVDPNLPFCVAAVNGYFGRDHGNGQGIPPDGPNRVEYGVYPGGGRFDNNSFQTTQNGGTDGARGAGELILWTSSFTDFARSEAALMAGTGEDARALLESGIRKSIAKVMSFQNLIPSSDLNFVIGSDPVTGEQTFASRLIPTSDDVDAYVAEALDRYDNASDKLDVVMKEYFIAQWGNGLEAYNLYRRTAKPNNMPPLIDPLAASASDFPRTMLYPANNVDLNRNATQKEPTTTMVFWDKSGPLR